MSRIIRCDRCGAEIDQTRGTVGYAALCARDIKTDDVSADNPFENWDFCDACMQAINACIRGAKIVLETDEAALTQEEKFEKILESADAGKKAKETLKKKKTFPGSGPSIDVGQAQALRDAGWPVKKIAEELKTTEPTIRRWTHAPEPKKPKPHEWAEREPYIGPGAQTMLDGKYREGAEDEDGKSE